MSFGKGGSVEKTTNNGQTSVDQGTAQRMQEIWQAAQRAGQAGPSGLTTGAADYNSGLMGAGKTGLSALSGDKGALGLLMDPYQQQVVNATNAQWDNTDARSRMATNDAATRAGAFGGGRHGVAEGVTIGENNRNRESQVAGLLSSGYGDAMQRAALLSQGGFQGAGANANLGMGGVGSPEQWYLQMLRQGFLGPTGQTSSGAQTGVGFNYHASTLP